MTVLLNEQYALRAAELLEEYAPLFPPQEAETLQSCAAQLRGRACSEGELMAAYAVLSRRFAPLSVVPGEETPQKGGERAETEEGERRRRAEQAELLRIVAWLIQGLHRNNGMGGIELC